MTTWRWRGRSLVAAALCLWLSAVALSAAAQPPAALAALPHGRVEWFRPAHHDLHAQFPRRCADVIVEHIQNGFLV